MNNVHAKLNIIDTAIDPASRPQPQGPFRFNPKRVLCGLVSTYV